VKTETPKLVTLELSTLECWTAFQALGVAVAGVSRKVFHIIRKTRTILKTIYDEREQGMALVIQECVEKDAMGNAKYTDDKKDFVWLKGKEKDGRERLADINNEKRTIEVVPILWDDLLPDSEDGVDNAGALFALADWGFVVDELEA